jgi:hypothetical protein
MRSLNPVAPARNPTHQSFFIVAGNTRRGKYHCTVDLLFDWFGFVCFANKNKNCWSVLQIKTKNVSCRTADSKSVKQEVNGTVILPPLVFPDCCNFDIEFEFELEKTIFKNFESEFEIWESNKTEMFIIRIGQNL